MRYRERQREERRDGMIGEIYWDVILKYQNTWKNRIKSLWIMFHMDNALTTKLWT